MLPPPYPPEGRSRGAPRSSSYRHPYLPTKSLADLLRPIIQGKLIAFRNFLMLFYFSNPPTLALRPSSRSFILTRFPLGQISFRRLFGREVLLVYGALPPTKPASPWALSPYLPGLYRFLNSSDGFGSHFVARLGLPRCCPPLRVMQRLRASLM